jgi:uncharacterized membrane protein
MKTVAHLWAIGYDDMERAGRVRDEIIQLGDKNCLILLDSAVVVRFPDGTLTLNGEPFVPTIRFRAHSIASFLAGLALGAPPLTGAAVGAFLRSTGAAASVDIGINEEFIDEVQGLMKPGTSAVFVLDQEGDMEALLRGIRGIGGTVLRTNVNLERAKLIQFTLATAAPDGL